MFGLSGKSEPEPKKPLRIAMVAACPFPANHGGAASIREMSQALAKRGHQVHVITYPLQQYDIPVTGLKIHRILPHWNHGHISVGPNKYKLFFDPLMIGKLCRVVFRENIDLIHTHNYEGTLIGFWAKMLTRRPILYNAVNSMSDELPGYRFIRPQALAVALGRVLDYVVPRLGDFITVVSNELYKYHLKQGIPPERMTTLPAGVYDEMFTHADGVRIRRQNSLNGCPLVVYTGVMDHFQRMDYLFQAMQQVIQAIPEARLLIMGNLVQNATPFYQMVQELGIAEHVTFLLNQPLSELPHCLAAADVTVISRPDTPGFPVKLLNYMSAGKPTVTFQGSAKGVAHLFNGIVVPDHDVQALGAGIVQLLKDPDLRQRLGARAREVVKSNFYWDLLAEIIEQIYETMLRTRTTYRILHPMEMELRQDLGRPIIFYDRRKDGGSPAHLPDRRKSAGDRRKSQQPINFPNRRRLFEPLE